LDKPDALEATPIVERMLKTLLSIIPDKGRPGADARRAIGDLLATAYLALYDGSLGPGLVNCLELVRTSGADLASMDLVRTDLVGETPQTLGATMVRNYALNMVLAEEGLIIQRMSFTSRQDVDLLISLMQAAFADPLETTADTMDAMTYRSLINLRAAIVNHLVAIGLPLPDMLLYQFNTPLPSLVISQRLYTDASRYDEIRNENKIVHPLFCPTIGQALSA
jgi:hypothetical protein